MSYVPDRGDVVWLSFDPQSGREQAGRRPALVLSPRAYNQRTSLTIPLPNHQSDKRVSFRGRAAV